MNSKAEYYVYFNEFIFKVIFIMRSLKDPVFNVLWLEFLSEDKILRTF